MAMITSNSLTPPPSRTEERKKQQQPQNQYHNARSKARKTIQQIRKYQSINNQSINQTLLIKNKLHKAKDNFFLTNGQNKMYTYPWTHSWHQKLTAQTGNITMKIIQSHTGEQYVTQQLKMLNNTAVHIVF